MAAHLLEPLIARSFDADRQTLCKLLLTLATGRQLLPLADRQDIASHCQCMIDTACDSFTAAFLIKTLPPIRSISQLSSLLTLLYQLDPPELISHMAELYEQLVERQVAKKHGVFYTPTSIARRLIAQADAHRPANHGPRTIADISSGSGIFLVEALRSMNTGRSPGEDLRSIYGVDRDPAALECARLLLQLEALTAGVPLKNSAAIVRSTIRRGNSLISSDCDHLKSLSHNDQQAIDAFSFERNFPKVYASSSGFDLIVGNPPYGLSRDLRISTAETKLLKQLYRGRIGGRINTYLLFMVRACELLAPDGILALVVPNAWLAIDEALEVRRLLIDQGALCCIDTFVEAPFGKLGVEVITFVAKRDAKNSSFVVNAVATPSSTKTEESIEVPFDTIRQDPSLRIPLTTLPVERSLLKKIEEGSLKLGNEASPFRASIALQAYARGRGTPPQSSEVVKAHPFHRTELQSPDDIPYLEGREIERLRTNWGGAYLHYGPWLAEYHPRERYTTPRVLIREILAPFPRLFRAAYTDQPFTYNRSVMHIHAQGESRSDSLKALAVLLNSTLAGFWLLQRGRKAQRKLFPKILAKDLNEFPLSRPFSLSSSILLTLHEEYLNANTSGAQEKVLNAIDECVYTLYMLDECEKDYLRALNTEEARTSTSAARAAPQQRQAVRSLLPPCAVENPLP